MDIVIIGAGKLGMGLAKSLSNEDHNITVID
ncbi:MAG: NAD-binding protein, partial [Eubacterium sp.]|nr:NAD-binding protein [Eubacterium sp.]